MKTRDRIIATALRLFNEVGYGAVTTAALAEHLGMAEGNLWYHFKTKRALLDAIGLRYAVAIEARLKLVQHQMGFVIVEPAVHGTEEARRRNAGAGRPQTRC